MTINLSSKGSSSLYPSLTPCVYGNAAFDNLYNAGYVEGFLGDGDYFHLPTSGTEDLKYYNSSKVEQWSIALTDVNAACDYWVGMILDDTDDLIYAIAVDTDTTPNTYYTCSINSAGTITNIGNDQPSVVDFISGLWMGGDVIDVNDDTTLIQRASTGSGNLFIRQGSGASTPIGMFEAEINISTGAFVSDPTLVSTWNTYMAPSYKTESGIYIGYFNRPNTTAATDVQIHIHDSATNRIDIPTSSIAIARSYYGARPIVWKDKIRLYSMYNGPSSYDITEFDAWVDKLAILAGVN